MAIKVDVGSSSDHEYSINGLAHLLEHAIIECSSKNENCEDFK